MAEISFKGLDEFQLSMKEVAELPDEIIDEMLNAGADVAAEAQRVEARRLGKPGGYQNRGQRKDYSTGITALTIKKGKVKVKDGQRVIYVTPTGTRRRGKTVTRNAEIAFLNEFGEHDLAMYEHQKMKVDREVAKRALGVAIAALEDFNDWSADAIKEQIKAKSEEEGIKSGQVMFTMRVALTGAPVTPGGAIEMAVVLKKDETLRRMKYSLSLLKKA